MTPNPRPYILAGDEDAPESKRGLPPPPISSVQGTASLVVPHYKQHGLVDGLPYSGRWSCTSTPVLHGEEREG
ncbi:hypothetical protein K466DRAFT_277570 [Polyporus arcularius HHB13444]|uniref:Uncharacterized protein n=1 Tax=Polyporus arcularius HHB13444 TaxID=1314778 RepID=A0A5C3P0H3_9APHY|nr:hypothetical protein K466DRAFT_277570 [Polyporus arcularius HHB13444]